MCLCVHAPAPAADALAPSAAAASPAAGQPCSSAPNGRPAAAPSGLTAGWSSSATGAPSPRETLGYLKGHTVVGGCRSAQKQHDHYGRCIQLLRLWEKQCRSRVKEIKKCQFQCLLWLKKIYILAKIASFRMLCRHETKGLVYNCVFSWSCCRKRQIDINAVTTD